MPEDASREELLCDRCYEETMNAINTMQSFEDIIEDIES